MRSLGLVGLFGLLTGILGAQDPTFTMYPPSGTYTQDTQVQTQSEGSLTYQFQFMENGTAQPIPLRSSLLLSALPGESRSYTLRITGKNPRGESLTKDFFYTIDKRALGTVGISPLPGTYDQDQKVVLTGLGQIFYSLDEGPWTLYQNPLVLKVPAAGWQVTRIKAYAEDSQKRRSPEKSWEFRMDRTQTPGAGGVKILSPVPGEFTNPQWLLLQTRGAETVKYTLDGSDPALSGEVYKGPVLLQKTGALTLKVWAKVQGRSEALTGQVAFSVKPGVVAPPGVPESGVKTEGFTVKVPSGGPWKAAASDSDPLESWKSPLEFSVVSGSQKVSVLRVSSGAAEFRWVYYMDDRKPQVPVFQVTGGFRPQIQILAHPEALVVVSKDATEPTAASAPYDGPWFLEDLTKKQVQELRARAIFPNGQISETASFKTSQVRSASMAPEFRWIKSSASANPLGLSFTISEGLSLIYEVAYQRGKCPIPHELSPEAGANFMPDVPWGQERTFYLRFAFRDSTGQIGAPTGEISLNVDHIPPLTPSWSVAGGKLVLAGEGSLFYSLTDKPVAVMEKQETQAYSAPVDLPPGLQNEKQTLYLQAYALDSAGNPSEPLVNQSILRDSRPPGILGFRGLSHKAVVAALELEIQPELSGTGYEVYYSLTTDGTPPGPASKGKLYSGPLRVQGIQGTTQGVQTLWNLKKDGKWLLAADVPLTVTQDLEAPQAPQFLNFPEGQVLTSKTTLEITPKDPSDTIYYTMTEDQPNGLSPLGPSAKLWEGSLTLVPQENLTKVYYFRFAVKDAAGNGFEILGLRPITLDLKIPGVPRIVGLPTVHRTSREVKLEFAPQKDPIYFLLTEDGSLPGFPTSFSSVYTQPLVLPGKEGEVQVYRIRSVSVNSRGVAGPYGDMVTLIVDRRPETAGEGALVTGSAAAPALGLLGIPESGVSKIPVVLQNTTPRGILRYESASGNLDPSPVGPYSPALGGTFLAPGKEGEEISYKLALQVFDPATNLPLSDSRLVTFTVDRRIPEAPSIRLTPDSKNPVVRFELENQRDPQYFRVKVQTLEGQGAPGPWVKYEKAVDLAAPGGRFARLEVEAYSQDLAGNQGPTVTSGIVLTQGVVYIAPGAKGKGTAEDPLGSFTEGLKKARAEGRHVIFLAQGQLDLEGEADLTDLEIFGGLNSQTWDPFSPQGRSVLVPGGQWSDAAFLSAYNGTLRLSGVSISDQGMPVQSLLLLENTKAFLREVSLSGRGNTIQRGILQTRGQLALNQVDIQVTGGGDDLTLLDLSQVKFWAQGLGLKALGGQGHLFGNFDRVEGGMSNATLDGSGASALETGLSLVQSDLKLDQCQFRLGGGAPLASALVLKDSFLEAIRLDMVLTPTVGATGIKLDGSSFVGQEITGTIGATQQFSHVVSAVGSLVKLSQSQFETSPSAYLAAFVVQGSKFEFKNSSLRAALGKGSQQGFLLQGENTLDLQTSRFNATGDQSSWLFNWPQKPLGKRIWEGCSAEGWTAQARWEKKTGLLSEVPEK